MRRFLTSLALLSCVFAGCGRDKPAVAAAPAAPAAEPSTSTAVTAPAPAVPAAPASTAPAPTAAAPTVVFLGDSLTAGLGLAEDLAYPAVIAQRLAEMKVPARVVNAGISGDTTAGGLARLSWLLQQKPAIVVVALGANDGLRGLPVPETESHLRQILKQIQAAGARPILCGMLVPPNYGPDYFTAFRAIFPKLAKELDVPLVPFLLTGVAADPKLNQADGIHPTAEGQKILADNVLPYLLAELKR